MVGVAHVEDHGVRLELAGDGHDVVPRIGVLFRAGAVEPKLDERPVAGAELGELGDVAGVIDFWPGRPIRIVAIPRREVVAEPDAALAAGVGKLRDDVALPSPPWRGAHRVIRRLRRPEAEAVVVLGGEDDVRGAGVLRDGDPLAAIQRIWVEPGGVERAVAPLAAVEGVDPEMAEQREGMLALPCQLGRCRDGGVVRRHLTGPRPARRESAAASGSRGAGRT
jgi:hypothetical protein